MQTIHSAQVKRVTQPNATVAPFCLARIGGVSAASLNGLALQQTAQFLHAALEAESTMQTLAPPLEEALYQLVSQTDGKRDLCRRMLKVKRNVHNQRAWAEMAEDTALVAAEFNDMLLRAQLAQWQQAAEEREAAYAQAASTYTQEVTEAAQTLAHSMSNAELQAGIAIASPNTLADLLRAEQEYRAEDWKPSSKLARSSLAYLSRAALKTSPLSTFTQLAVATFDCGIRNSEGGSAEPVSYHSQSAIHNRNAVHGLRALPFSWLQLIARDHELAATLQFEANAGLYYREPGKIRVLTTQHEFHDAFATRTERFATRQFDPEQVPELAALLASNRRVSYHEVMALLKATGRFPQPHQTLVQLLDVQFLRPVAPYSSGEAQALRKLAAVVTQVESERATSVATMLNEVNSLTESCQHADAATRLQLFTQLRQIATDIFAALNSPAPAWLQRACLLYEDVRYTSAPITLSQRIERDLQTVATMVRPRLIRTHLYDYLYQYFVRRFGVAAETDDILSFLQDFREREDFQEILHRALAEDQRIWREGETISRAQLSGGTSAVVPTAAIYFQLAAQSEEALQRGEYMFVVNEVGAGHGGLMGRFTDLLGAEHGHLKEHLAAWVQATHSDTPVLEVPLMGEWTNLHSRLGVTGQALQWPGELSTTESDEANNRMYRLRDLRLRAEAQTGTLYFTDQAGQAVSPAYLGLMPSLRFNGVMGLLLTLIDPWVGNPEIGDKKLPLLEGAPVVSEEIEFTPRRVQGHIVLRRARWRFPVAQVPVRCKGETDFAFFVRVQQWRTQHNLPEEVFATVERNALEFDARYRKPIWVHFGSPHTLELLRQIVVEDAVAITFTEALPTRQQHWVSARTAETEMPETRVSELLGLVRWPMPAAPVQATRQRAKAACTWHQTNEWLYYKIYPARHDQLNDVLRQIVAPASELAHATGQLKRWFFLRYHDARGPHIRLRLQGSASFCAGMHEQISKLTTQTLSQLKSEKRPPLVVLEGAAFPVLQSVPGYVRAEYEPEYEKYGGEVGVAIAEKLFEVSSELALRALSLSPQQLAALSLRLTKWLVYAIHPAPEEQRQFLTNYFWYWSGQNRPTANLVRAKIEQVVQQCDGVENGKLRTISAALQDAMEEYRQAATMTVRALATAKVPVLLTRLCFDYAHMTNNRLGLTSIEESYLAALLLR